MIKKFITSLIIGASIFALAGCGQGGEKAKDVETLSKEMTKVEKIKEAGKIIVGTSADYAPYEFHKQIDGKDEIVGFDISIAEEIASDLEVELQIKDMKFDGLLAALEAEKIDFVIAGMTPTEERKKNVDFSKVYYQAVQSLVVKSEDINTYKTMNDFKGKKIGVQKGSTQEALAKEQLKDSQIKSLGKVTDLILELKNGKVDALVIELPVASAYANKNDDISVSNVNLEITDEGSAIAVKKGNSDLVKSIDKTLDKLINDKSIDKYVTEANELAE